MGGLSENLIRRAAHGEPNDGNCESMLDAQCSSALQNQLEQTAFCLVANPTDNSPAPSNLTAGSLPRVCADIHEALTKDGAVPDACAKFVGPKMSWYDGEYSNVTFTYDCKLHFLGNEVWKTITGCFWRFHAAKDNPWNTLMKD
jgi:hypothetical protein